MPWEVGTRDAGECRHRMFGVKVQTDAGDPIALNKPPVSLNKMQVWT